MGGGGEGCPLLNHWQEALVLTVIAARSFSWDCWSPGDGLVFISCIMLIPVQGWGVLRTVMRVLLRLGTEEVEACSVLSKVLRTSKEGLESDMFATMN